MVPPGLGREERARRSARAAAPGCPGRCRRPLTSTPPPAGRTASRTSPSAPDGVEGVVEEVQEHLLHLREARSDDRHVRVVRPGRCGSARPPPPSRRSRPSRRAPRRRRPARRSGPTRRENPSSRCVTLRPRSTWASILPQPLAELRRRQRSPSSAKHVGEHADLFLDDRQRVVDLVGHRRRHPADGGHLLRLRHRLVEGRPFLSRARRIWLRRWRATKQRERRHREQAEDEDDGHQRAGGRPAADDPGHALARDQHPGVAAQPGGGHELALCPPGRTRSTRTPEWSGRHRDVGPLHQAVLVGVPGLVLAGAVEDEDVGARLEAALAHQARSAGRCRWCRAGSSRARPPASSPPSPCAGSGGTP